MKNLNPLHEYKEITSELLRKAHFPDKYAITRAARKGRKLGGGSATKSVSGVVRRPRREPPQALNPLRWEINS